MRGDETPDRRTWLIRRGGRVEVIGAQERQAPLVTSALDRGAILVDSRPGQLRFAYRRLSRGVATTIARFVAGVEDGRARASVALLEVSSRRGFAMPIGNFFEPGGRLVRDDNATMVYLAGRAFGQGRGEGRAPRRGAG